MDNFIVIILALDSLLQIHLSEGSIRIPRHVKTQSNAPVLDPWIAFHQHKHTHRQTDEYQAKEQTTHLTGNHADARSKMTYLLPSRGDVMTYNTSWHHSTDSNKLAPVSKHLFILLTRSEKIPCKSKAGSISLPSAQTLPQDSISIPSVDGMETQLADVILGSPKLVPVTQFIPGVIRDQTKTMQPKQNGASLLYHFAPPFVKETGTSPLDQNRTLLSNTPGTVQPNKYGASLPNQASASFSSKNGTSSLGQTGSSRPSQTGTRLSNRSGRSSHILAGRFAALEMAESPSVRPKRPSEWTERSLQQADSSCRHHLETKLVYWPGCIPKSVLTTRCQGTCHSHSKPEWNVPRQEFSIRRHCTCCSPTSIRLITLRFLCPRRPRGFVVKRVGYPFRCTCRPCAEASASDDDQP